MSNDLSEVHAGLAGLDEVRELGQQLRVDSVRAVTSAGAGHPTSSMSAADLLAVLVARHLRYDWDDPDEVGNDHLIFSKGHASPLLYSVYKAVGVVSDEELMTGYRRFGSRLQGHPTPVLPWVDVATGSDPSCRDRNARIRLDRRAPRRRWTRPRRHRRRGPHPPRR